MLSLPRLEEVTLRDCPLSDVVIARLLPVRQERLMGLPENEPRGDNVVLVRGEGAGRGSVGQRWSGAVGVRSNIRVLRISGATRSERTVFERDNWEMTESMPSTSPRGGERKTYAREIEGKEVGGTFTSRTKRYRWQESVDIPWVRSLLQRSEEEIWYRQQQREGKLMSSKVNNNRRVKSANEIFPMWQEPEKTWKQLRPPPRLTIAPFLALAGLELAKNEANDQNKKSKRKRGEKTSWVAKEKDRDDDEDDDTDGEGKGKKEQEYQWRMKAGGRRPLELSVEGLEFSQELQRVLARVNTIIMMKKGEEEKENRSLRQQICTAKGYIPVVMEGDPISLLPEKNADTTPLDSDYSGKTTSRYTSSPLLIEYQNAPSAPKKMVSRLSAPTSFASIIANDLIITASKRPIRKQRVRRARMNGHENILRLPLRLHRKESRIEEETGSQERVIDNLSSQELQQVMGRQRGEMTRHAPPPPPRESALKLLKLKMRERRSKRGGSDGNMYNLVTL